MWPTNYDFKIIFCQSSLISQFEDNWHSITPRSLRQGFDWLIHILLFNPRCQAKKSERQWTLINNVRSAIIRLHVCLYVCMYVKSWEFRPATTCNTLLVRREYDNFVAPQKFFRFPNSDGGQRAERLLVATSCGYSSLITSLLRNTASAWWAGQVSDRGVVISVEKSI